MAIHCVATVLILVLIQFFGDLTNVANAGFA